MKDTAKGRVRTLAGEVLTLGDDTSQKHVLHDLIQGLLEF